jgi:hypothetical protein
MCVFIFKEIETKKKAQQVQTSLKFNFSIAGQN